MPGGPWRIHFHLPLHAAPPVPLANTVPIVRQALDVLLGGACARCDHFEVETYTWQVLPAAQRPRTADDLATGIAAELAFTRDLLHRLGLTQTSANHRGRTGTAVPQRQDD
jgi:hypothetical protein